ncbi:hypothetical protein [Microbacterium sp. GCS4]|uniref:hypothetical protein n=1 Tax=Microbacterium sp. GCS4 TaxID=1692239 RepID=UPI00067FD146|nr:hypothetical protein [Microbacterium sp. GCS4]KNY04033.1 hypothetical protein AKH00_16860 [Microbacterium sp. GCS4]
MKNAAARVGAVAVLALGLIVGGSVAAPAPAAATSYGKRITSSDPISCDRKMRDFAASVRGQGYRVTYYYGCWWSSSSQAFVGNISYEK